MPPKEAKARIKINNLLQESGWRLLDNNTGNANVVLENNVKITHTVTDDLGEDFEKTTNGYADYLLLDDRGFPLIVLEAKSEDKNPLVGTYIISGTLRSPTLLSLRSFQLSNQ